MAKEYLTVRIDSDVKNQFYQLVKQKYESLHGGLSAEAEEAFRAWLRSQSSQMQITPAKINPRYPHVHVYMDQIIRMLKEEYGCLLQVDIGVLKEAISKVRGSDERTIRKWIDQLLKERKLKRLGPVMFEIV